MNAKLVSDVVCCLCSVVFLVTCITSSRTEAASYQETDGTIVDPILETSGRLHEEYSGNNLEPGANLADANLTDANLTDANLSGVRSGGIIASTSDLSTNWRLTGGYLVGPEANLSGARCFSLVSEDNWLFVGANSVKLIAYRYRVFLQESF